MQAGFFTLTLHLSEEKENSNDCTHAGTRRPFCVLKSPGTHVCNLHKQLTSLELQSEALISLTANILLIEDIAATASPLKRPSEELLNLSNSLPGTKQLNVLLLPKERKIGMLKMYLLQIRCSFHCERKESSWSGSAEDITLSFVLFLQNLILQNLFLQDLPASDQHIKLSTSLPIVPVKNEEL